MNPITISIKPQGLDEIKAKSQKIQNLVDQLNIELKEFEKIKVSIQI